MFLAVSLLIPLGEVFILGRTEPFGKVGIIYAVLGALAIYWWYYLDKIERGFRAGAFQNISVAVFSIIGLPVYFVRSRGWLRGALATFIALLILIVGGALGYVGELAGAALRSNNALQRSVMHRGRTVLAMNCALAGPECGSCPSAELGR